MKNIVLHILNASGELDAKVDAIENAFKRASKTAAKLLDVKGVDIVVRNVPGYAIPELGVGGITMIDGKGVYLSLDIQKNPPEKEIFAQMIHELHHAARFQAIGCNNNTLAAHLVSEGLACLFEDQAAGRVPIYAKAKISKKDVDAAKKALFIKKGYDYARWFFGTKEISRWFVYTYGYEKCKEYALAHNKTASELVDLKVKELFK